MFREEILRGRARQVIPAPEEFVFEQTIGLQRSSVSCAPCSARLRTLRRPALGSRAPAARAVDRDHWNVAALDGVPCAGVLQIARTCVERQLDESRACPERRMPWLHVRDAERGRGSPLDSFERVRTRFERDDRLEAFASRFDHVPMCAPPSSAQRQSVTCCNAASRLAR
jgi:hypothetical protein